MTLHRHTFRTALCGTFAEPLAAIERLERDGWTARPDTAAVPLPAAPADWSADPFTDRNWRFQLHAWRPLDAYVSAHDTLGDARALGEAVRLMAMWSEAEAGQDDDSLFWNDMGTGLRAAKLGYVLFRIAADDALSGPMREIVIDLGRRHLARLRDESFFSLSNHGLFQVHGLVALLDVLPLAPEAEGGRAFAEQMFNRILASQFGREGVHLEHSPGYHSFALLTLKKMIASRWYGDMVEARKIVDSAAEALPWLVFPDGALSAAGDSDRIKPRFKAPNTGRTGARLFAEAGYGVVRTGWKVKERQAAMLLVTGGHHSHVHKHADDLSFELFDRGRFWIVDSGKYSYSRKEWRAYTDSSRAHNSIQLSLERPNNGLSLTPPAGGLLRGGEWDGEAWVIEGAIDRPRIGARHHRVFRYVPGQSLTLIDRIDLAKPGEVVAWLHLAPDLIAEAAGDGWRVLGATIQYQVKGATLETERFRGQVEPEIQGWVAQAYHRRTPNDALGARLRGRSIELITTLAFTD